MQVFLSVAKSCIIYSCCISAAVVIRSLSCSAHLTLCCYSQQVCCVHAQLQFNHVQIIWSSYSKTRAQGWNPGNMRVRNSGGLVIYNTVGIFPSSSFFFSPPPSCTVLFLTLINTQRLAVFAYSLITGSVSAGAHFVINSHHHSKLLTWTWLISSTHLVGDSDTPGALTRASRSCPPCSCWLEDTSEGLRWCRHRASLQAPRARLQEETHQKET